MNYIGENLIPGQLGHFCVVLSFVASLLSAFSYFQSASKRNTPEESDWLRLGRFSFMLHGTERSFSIIGLLFYILVGKMYEYNYAWANVSDDLPVQYVFSAFWKEQQGSFLLWSFWHIILSAIIIVRGGKWEASCTDCCGADDEAVIGSTAAGLYFGHFRLGASPFDLLRDTMSAPIFAAGRLLD
jgi:cytochrome c-type biogenesis protein CcmF